MLTSNHCHVTRFALRLTRHALNHYQFFRAPAFADGRISLQTFRAVRIFAQLINQRRDLVTFPERAVRAGQLNALGLIEEIMQYIVCLYAEQVDPQVLGTALARLEDTLGAEALAETLRRFVDTFPPAAVYRGEVTAESYLAETTEGVSNRQLALIDLLTVWLKRMNPACEPYREFFDDLALAQETVYLGLIKAFHDFFDAMPPFGPDHQNLIDMLRSPAIAVPHSLTGQLEYILQRWGILLTSAYLYRLLGGLDLIKEEEKAIFLGPGPALVPSFDALEFEPELFSPDKDWMPRTVVMAKNTHVWLDQLAKKYRRSITRLDEIPDEELDALARAGFTGLWLIGVWERSIASQWIKQRCGNPEAAPSAYSLYDYTPANDLGGFEALDRLRDRAWQRGIRLASDMVPNHMGIFSRWMIEHPEWFLSLDYPPFPSYGFTSESLSPDPNVGLYIEDHYYSRNDAAVVFKRVDHRTGDTRYIYHGNDGTSMPWNDTAQLNYLLPQVREAVIQTILHVARHFPIIRFDAAMTLAKRHYQRLWFPEPGSGGAIPSRAEHGMPKAQFNEVFPTEFWREVVDRVAAEVPDTLLLAEAFWLMEGYFVRTLGMHRVYNSAFMNMLRDEDNAKYRSVMKNTLEFDPDILKRYVNFMNNPDERTAVEQFGKGDKYFGICVLMCTLPGLPMFGHGQVEGYAEKYGMEYRRAYWDEQPDSWLVDRHAREIFPLLRRRSLFADVEHFTLYDFYSPEGWVNEDVFAYSNRQGDERGLVIYHNKFADARGWVHRSVGFSQKQPDGTKRMVQRTLGEGLALENDPQMYTIFRDQATGLEYLRNNHDLCTHGLYVELHAYHYMVFVDFRQVRDNAWRHYGNLCDYLGGRGVPSVDIAMRELFLQPVHGPFKELVNTGYFTYLLANRVEDPTVAIAPALLDEARGKALTLLREAKRFSQGGGDEMAIAEELLRKLTVVLQLPALEERFSDIDLREAIVFMREGMGEERWGWGILLSWLFSHALGKVLAYDGFEEISRSWQDEWLLNRNIISGLQAFGLDEEAAGRAAVAVGVLTLHHRWPVGMETATGVLEVWLSDPDVQRLLHVNRFKEVLWFNREAFTNWLRWMLLVAVVDICADPALSPDQQEHACVACMRVIRTIQQAVEASGYQVERLIAITAEAEALA